MKIYIMFLLCLFTLTLAVAQTTEKKSVAAKDTLKKEFKHIKLEEVVIKAKRPLLQVEIDKTIINVSSMISSATSNTLEVLEKTPGVTVDANGGISLNGRGGVMVLIDFRQTYMSAADLAGYLKSLPGSSLDKIELIDNPSSKYDAAGNAIINIKLKKDRTVGMIGSIATGYNKGELARSNHSLNLNYNRKKLNIFSNVGYSKNNSLSREDNDRRFYNDEKQLLSKILLLNHQRNTYDGINGSLGLDYTLSSATTLGMQVNLSKNDQNGRLTYNSQSFNAVNQLDSLASGRTLFEDSRTNLGINFNVSHLIGKSGKALSFDASYLKYDGDGNQNTNDEFLYLLPSDSRIYTLKEIMFNL